MNVISISQVNEKYRYILDRVNFENDRAVQNMVFMLNEHMSDADDSYLKSDLYRRLSEKAIDARLESWNISIGIAINAVQNVSDNKDKVVIPSLYKYEYDKTFHDYKLIYCL